MNGNVVWIRMQEKDESILELLLKEAGISEDNKFRAYELLKNKYASQAGNNEEYEERIRTITNYLHI